MKYFHRHHRKPRSIGGSGQSRNISMVPQYKHVAWHQLFCNYTAEQIAGIINEVWIDPDFELVVRRRPYEHVSKRNAKPSAKG